MNYYVYGNGGSKNHGCEAISRATCGIFDDIRVRLISNLPEEDKAYNVDEICQLVQASDVAHPRLSRRFAEAYLALKLRHDPVPLDQLPYMDMLALAKRGDIALSAGGDNYCYANTGAAFYGKCREFLRKRGVKTVLWGCSVEPDVIAGEVREDLSRYDLIVARESISFEALRAVNPNTILAPDPVFALPCSPGHRPEGLGSRPYIGINISPLIQARESCNGITMGNYCALVECILSETDRDIALIPHVVWSHTDDRQPLGQLYEQYRHTGRVFLVEDQNCMQLKDIISGCEVFVGARTHATIAAYSSCVPTMVVGYSVKARGIARDLFGTEEGYVLPVQQLREPSNLTEAFKALYNQKDILRSHLQELMPRYVAGIDKARNAVERLGNSR